MKRLGFAIAHIWACPPLEGDNYIFHRHPIQQKTPKCKRLQEWYKNMFEKGMIETTILDYQNLYKQVLEDGLGSVTDLPYFDDDFWPKQLEQLITEVEREISNVTSDNDEVVNKKPKIVESNEESETVSLKCFIFKSQDFINFSLIILKSLIKKCLIKFFRT